MPFCLSCADRVANLRDGDAALHGVQQALRTALGADPHAVAAQFRKLRGHARVQAVRARDALERNAQAAAPHLRGILIQPAVMNGEHIVGEPQLLGMVAVEDPLHLVHHGEPRTGAGASSRTWNGCTSGNDRGSRAR